jgi:phosphatidylinositol alpha-mannosyltransferase
VRIGIVCPYSFDVPGGVQIHVRGLAEHFIRLGHDVSVLAPADDDDALPPYLQSAGRAVPVRYNGSVARLSFGPVTSARVSRWLEEGDFEVVHLHEPVTPSVSMLALWSATAPVVATFHTSTLRSRAMHAANPLLRSSLEKIRARIAVSEEARRTVRSHLGGDAYIIPNGVDVAVFDRAAPDRRWTGTPERPTMAFLGRIDEPRKGLAVLLAAMPAVLERAPGIRLLVAGPGDVREVAAKLPARVAAATEFLGGVSEVDKAALLSSVDLYVAPHIGGESFGIVLVEAMAAGAPVLASDLTAFVNVLDGGVAGALFPTGDAVALADRVLALLADQTHRTALRTAGHRRALAFDWSVVADRVMAVYETVIESAEAAPFDASRQPTLWGRFIRGASRGSET